VAAVQPAPTAARAHAKINLSLRVLAREQSGYHQIETLFCALALADDVTIEPRGDDEIVLDVRPDAAGTRPDLGPTERNLAWRAAALFRRSAPGGGVTIALTKRIPHGAGLGGGSSDAAAVLTAMNTLPGNPLSEHTLLQLGARLGSDVPFFLSRSALAFGWGRGNRLFPVAPLPEATVLLAVPPDRVPTADAYGALAHVRQRAPGEDVIDPALEAVVASVPRSWNEVGALAMNDFEDVVFRRIPVLAELLAVMDHAGARVARMTGTGSVVFGVFEDPDGADRAEREITRRHAEVRTMVTTTLSDVA
jgi:4-diphosphocytidyl-2-C-methyl-D-erythritol kinase